MKSAEQWTALYEDGGSALNSPTALHITDIFREIQREAFDLGANAMLRMLPRDIALSAYRLINISKLEGRP